MNSWNPYRLATLFVAVLGLVFGWAVTPAQADPRPHTHGGGGGGGELATVNLAGSMFTTNGLPVGVSQDSSKRIRFGNSNFDIDTGSISLRFNTGDCFEAAGDFEDGDQVAFENVLAAADNITSGSFEVSFDRKKVTGELVLEYTGVLGGNGTRILFTDRFEPDSEHRVDESIKGDMHTFTFRGDIFLRQLTPGGAINDPILGCTGQSVTLILDRSDG